MILAHVGAGRSLRSVVAPNRTREYKRQRCELLRREGQPYFRLFKCLISFTHTILLGIETDGVFVMRGRCRYQNE